MLGADLLDTDQLRIVEGAKCGKPASKLVNTSTDVTTATTTTYAVRNFSVAVNGPGLFTVCWCPADARGCTNDDEYLALAAPLPIRGPLLKGALHGSHKHTDSFRSLAIFIWTFM